MIIQCIRGGKLELSATRLTEVSGYMVRPYYVDLKDWFTNPETFQIFPVGSLISFHPGKECEYGIGCRHFSKKVYGQITRAAKKAAGVLVRKTKARKTSKARKTKGKKVAR